MAGIRDELFFQLLRMYRMEAFNQLAEFLQGETAVMIYLTDFPEELANPSSISDNLHLSRPRIAQVLTSLSHKGWVTLESAPDDRRKTIVRPTEEGLRTIGQKRSVVERYFDRLIERLGDEKAEKLSVMIREIVDKMEETPI